MRTQNPPPLKACRFDSDLGHHHRIPAVGVFTRRIRLVLRSSGSTLPARWLARVVTIGESSSRPRHEARSSTLIRSSAFTSIAIKTPVQQLAVLHALALSRQTQRIERHVQAEFVSQLEAIRDRPCDVVNPQRQVCSSVGAAILVD
jgi:hypothetical protein